MGATRLAVGLCAVGCATKFSPEPDSGVATGPGAMSASGGTSGGLSSSDSGGESSSSGMTGSSGGVGTSSGEGTSSGLPGNAGGDGGSATAPGDGGPASAPTCPAKSTLTAGDTNATISVGGTTRQYIVHVPTSVTGKPAVPLVVDYHPILTDYNYERQNSGYAAKADSEGFIVVFPNGIDNAWNVGPCCTTSRTVDDVGFSRALIAKLEGETCIDAKRVYAVGYSMGGGMAMDMACNAADIIAAIAPAAFDLMDPSNGWNCKPSRPINVISFRSTGDPIVPYAGGPTNPPNGLPVTITFLGAVKTFQTWAHLDQCTGSPADNSSLGTADGTCQTYSQCAQGVSATLCTKQGGGHDTGNPDVAWSMIKNYTLP